MFFISPKQPTGPIRFCFQSIKFPFLYLFPVVSAGFFVNSPWQRHSPQSDGVTRAYSKAVQIGGPLDAVTEEYGLKKDYDEKHGAPNAASPKVFIKYFFVNTVTGEKSSEMLVLATLQEDQPDQPDGE